VLTHDHGFTLVDYETAHWGDPTMDLGFMLSHLLLKAVKRHPCLDDFFELTRAFWRGYEGEVSFRTFAELHEWGVRHCGACLLARMDGTSPVDYLTDEQSRAAVRRIGRRLLREHSGDWEAVVKLVDAECAPLS
jgi:5-methylthioribose kinase